MNTVTTYECDGCGECCRHLLIEARPLDVLREPRIDEDSHRKDGKAAAVSLPILQQTWLLNGLGDAGMVCRFLDSDNRCGIYATRPATCVAFEAGGHKCQMLRQQAGLPLLTPVERTGVVAEITAACIADAGDEEDDWP